MVSGAVIIGRQGGMGMANPFTTSDFHDLRLECNLALITSLPVEVAYPESIGEDGVAFEGVLVNVYGGDKEYGTPEKLEERVRERLVFAAQRTEDLWCKAAQEGRRPFDSDLTHEKVCWVGDDTDSKELLWRPYMEVIATYPEAEEKLRYPAIALDLIVKTSEARIKYFIKRQERRTEDFRIMAKDWAKR